MRKAQCAHSIRHSYAGPPVPCRTGSVTNSSTALYASIEAHRRFDVCIDAALSPRLDVRMRTLDSCARECATDAAVAQSRRASPAYRAGAAAVAIMSLASALVGLLLSQLAHKRNWPGYIIMEAQLLLKSAII